MRPTPQHPPPLVRRSARRRRALLPVVLVGMAVLAALALPGGAAAGTDAAAAVVLPTGTPLLLLANPQAPPVAVLVEGGRAEVLERRDGWLRVRLGPLTGWVDSAGGEPETVEDGATPDSRHEPGRPGTAGAEPDGEGTPDPRPDAADRRGTGTGPQDTAPGGDEGAADRHTGDTAPRGAGPGGNGPADAEPADAGPVGVGVEGADVAGGAPVTAAGGLAPAADRHSRELQRARSLLAGGGRWGTAGPFDLVTDLDDEGLLADLDRLAAAVTDLYHRRYGLPVPATVTGPVRPARGPGTVVLFTGEEAFARFRAGAGEGPADLPGFTAGRLAVLHAGGRTRSQVSRLFVHEVVHLLNRHALGPAPPPWIDEGLAGDLELFPAPGDGRLLEVPLGPTAVRLAGAGRAHGPLVALERLVLDARRGRLEDLSHLRTLTPETLHRSPRRPELYALSALWVRFLLEGGDEARAAAFRRHLQPLPTAPPTALPPLLPPGTDPAFVERRFRHWLADLHRTLVRASRRR